MGGGVHGSFAGASAFGTTGAVEGAAGAIPD